MRQVVNAVVTGLRLATHVRVVTGGYEVGAIITALHEEHRERNHPPGKS